MDTNFRDCVYINFNLLLSGAKKLLLVISVNSFLPIVTLKLLSKFQLLSLKMKFFQYLSSNNNIIMLNMHKHISKKK